jgi:hypothetical protein
VRVVLPVIPSEVEGCRYNTAAHDNRRLEYYLR